TCRAGRLIYSCDCGPSGSSSTAPLLEPNQLRASWHALVVFSVLAGALASRGWARDDLLRGSSRDLSAKEKQALSELVGELGKPDPEVRNRAVRRLEQVGRAAIPALAEAL